jgi:hypothetical protein
MEMEKKIFCNAIGRELGVVVGGYRYGRRSTA